MDQVEQTSSWSFRGVCDLSSTRFEHPTLVFELDLRGSLWVACRGLNQIGKVLFRWCRKKGDNELRTDSCVRFCYTWEDKDGVVFELLGLHRTGFDNEESCTDVRFR